MPFGDFLCAQLPQVPSLPPRSSWTFGNAKSPTLSVIAPIRAVIDSEITARPIMGTARAPQIWRLGYLTNGPVRGGFVPVEHLVLVVLQAPHSQSGLPLAGFSAERVEWGVAWGGADRNPFAKDLALEPQLAARGRRLDLTRSRLLELGLRLEHALHRAGRHPRLRLRRRFSLPPLWAAFRAADAAGLQGDGPEFSEAARMA
jgi:hypothetical protein